MKYTGFVVLIAMLAACTSTSQRTVAQEDSYRKCYQIDPQSKVEEGQVFRFKEGHVLTKVPGARSFLHAEIGNRDTIDVNTILNKNQEVRILPTMDFRVASVFPENNTVLLKSESGRKYLVQCNRHCTYAHFQSLFNYNNEERCEDINVVPASDKQEPAAPTNNPVEI